MQKYKHLQLKFVIIILFICNVCFLQSYLPVASKVGRYKRIPLQNQKIKEKIEEKKRPSANWKRFEGKDYEKLLSKQNTIVLNLQTLLQLASDDNLSIEIESYSVKEAQAKLVGASAQFLPSVSFVQDINRRDGNIQLFSDQTIQVTQTSYQPRVLASFDVFQGGKVLFGWIAQKNLLDASNAQFNSQKQKSLTDVASSYTQLQRYREQLEAEFVRKEQASLNLEQRETALALGDDIKLSVLLARQELDKANAQIAALKASMYIESNKLNKLLNLPIETLILPAEKLEEKDVLDFTSTFEFNNLIVKAIQGNPSLKVNKEILKAYKAQEIQSIAPFLPKATISSSTGYIGPGYDDLVKNNNFALTVRYDALEHLGGSALANFLESKQLKNKSRAELLLKIKELEADINQLFLNVVSGKEVVKANQSVLDASKEAYRNAKERLDAEVGTPYELKVAQTDLSNARAVYYESLANYRIAEFNLMNKLGIVSIKSLVEGVKL
ncbi:MAG TPA: TolC family protein [Vampirovibrionales bacterium]